MRIAGVFKPSDHPSSRAGQINGDVLAFFNGLFPGVTDPEIDRGHTGLAILAHNPVLAAKFADLSRFLVLDAGFGKKADLREIAMMAVNLELGCSFGATTRMPAARAAGLSDEQIAAIPLWRSTALLDAEQRLVAGFAYAAASGGMSDSLMDQGIEVLGERAVIELLALVAFWAAWAIILNAAQP